MFLDPARAAALPRLGSDSSLKLRERAHAVIPGGTHTYAKGDDQFPELAPTFIQRGDGCRVWDTDGNVFVEYGMGLRSVALGHSFAPVVDAAFNQLQLGTNYVRPALIEIECAESLLGLIPQADMAKFCKDGSTANTAAITLARAYTGRDLVAICADDPFLSYNDWFITTTPMGAGIPKSVQQLTLRFEYNDLGSAESLFTDHPGQIACVILEAERTEKPRDGFLHGLKELCERNGTLFVLDEMITGFRWNLGGAQAEYDLEPDLSTFGKALANGFALSALVGKREIMELGGLRDRRERVFLLSTTHGAETHALAAAIATMRVYREEPVIQTLHARGKRLREGIVAAAQDAGVEEFFQVVGRDSNLVYATRDVEGALSQPFRTLFLQEMIKRGFLTPSFVVSYSHDDRVIDRTVEAVHEALGIYRRALTDGIDGYLSGRPVQPVMRGFS
jgi:glutamate-1-semialdehyde 2,1-aminomutase